MKLNSFWKLPRKIVVYLDDQRPTFPSNSIHCIDLHNKSIDWFLCNGNINPYWLNNLITLITKIFFFYLKGIFNQLHTSVGHIREVGPQTRDFLGNPRPETSLRYDPGTKTWDPKSATRDLRPETHFIGETRDLRPTTIKWDSIISVYVGLETQKPEP